MELLGGYNGKKLRHPPSVPFLWELKPGTPNKDWKPEKTSFNPPVLPPPVKLVASVPFQWEERPGKPLPCFSQPPLPISPTNLISFPSPTLYAQSDDDKDSDDCDGDDEQGTFELDVESLGIVTNESFSSAVATVPMPETPSSETDNSTSSYATGTSRLVGDSFLECLFPLLPPKSSFLEKAGYSENGSQIPSKLDRESNCNVVVRRPPTLGELIMMSRRKSNRKKAVPMRKQHLSMEFINNRAFGCGILGISSKGIGELHRIRKWQPKLNLK